MLSECAKDMLNECECSGGINDPSLKQIKGDGIVGIEIFGGGNKFCHGIEIKLKSGKFLTIEKDLDIQSYGIFPRIKYNVGSWVEVKTNKEECQGQLFFDFFNKN